MLADNHVYLFYNQSVKYLLNVCISFAGNGVVDLTDTYTINHLHYDVEGKITEINWFG